MLICLMARASSLYQCGTDSSDKRRGLLAIGHAYLIFRAIQDIEVVGLEMKSWMLQQISTFESLKNL